MRDLMKIQEGLILNSQDRKQSIDGLRKIGFTGSEIVNYFENHLDVIDDKNQNMLAFSANYLAVVGGSFYIANINTQDQVAQIFLYATIVCIALALITSFWNVNKIIWQEYHWRDYQWAMKDISPDAEAELLATDLISAVSHRTRSLRVSRLFYIFSFGLAADTIAVPHLIHLLWR